MISLTDAIWRWVQCVIMPPHWRVTLQKIKSSDFESAYKQTGMHVGICINTENFLLGL